jgi:hypothetical protein
VSDCGRELVVEAEGPGALGELGYLVLFYVDEPAFYRGCSILEVAWEGRRRRWGAVRGRRRRMRGRRPALHGQCEHASRLWLFCILTSSPLLGASAESMRSKAASGRTTLFSLRRRTRPLRVFECSCFALNMVRLLLLCPPLMVQSSLPSTRLPRRIDTATDRSGSRTCSAPLTGTGPTPLDATRRPCDASDSVRTRCSRPSWARSPAHSAKGPLVTRIQIPLLRQRHYRPRDVR